MRWLLVLAITVLTACGSASGGEAITRETAPTSTTGSVEGAREQGCAHVVNASIRDDSGSFTITATVSSDDTGWDKYADAWQVWDEGGAILGERVLAHPHESEQPFTRSQSGLVIPEGVRSVTIAARDSVVGFCGDVYMLEVPGR